MKAAIKPTIMQEWSDYNIHSLTKTREASKIA